MNDKMIEATYGAFMNSFIGFMGEGVKPMTEEESKEWHAKHSYISKDGNMVITDKEIIRAKYGKYYLLDNTKMYFCPALHRYVKFAGKLVVKCDSSFGKDFHFGILVDTPENGPDRVSSGEIEFCNVDIESEYKLQDLKINYVDYK